MSVTLEESIRANVLLIMNELGGMNTNVSEYWNSIEGCKLNDFYIEKNNEKEIEKEEIEKEEIEKEEINEVEIEVEEINEVEMNIAQRQAAKYNTNNKSGPTKKEIYLHSKHLEYMSIKNILGNIKINFPYMGARLVMSCAYKYPCYSSAVQKDISSSNDAIIYIATCNIMSYLYEINISNIIYIDRKIISKIIKIYLIDSILTFIRQLTRLDKQRIWDLNTITAKGLSIYAMAVYGLKVFPNGHFVRERIPFTNNIIMHIIYMKLIKYNLAINRKNVPYMPGPCTQYGTNKEMQRIIRQIIDLRKAQ
jgi:hypothetical protein